MKLWRPPNWPPPTPVEYLIVALLFAAAVVLFIVSVRYILGG